MVKQSTATNIMVLMVAASDHVTGLAGLTLTITVSVDGAAFTTPIMTVIDRGSGWYKLELTTSHTGTLGDYAIHITGAAADPTDLVIRVVAVDHAATSFGLSIAKTTNITGFNDIAATAIVSSGAITTSGGAITTATNVTTVNGLAANTLTAAALAVDAVTEIQAGLATPTNITAGTITTATNVTTVNGLAANTLTAAALASDAVTEIQAGLATPTNITAGTITTVTNVTTVNGLAANVVTAAALATDAVTEIAAGVDVVLSLAHGSEEWGDDAGTGAFPITVTVTNGVVALENATVRVSDGVTPHVLTTNVSGQATFNLDMATYTVSITKVGHTFTSTTRTVTGSQTGTLVNNLVMTVVAIPSAPASPTMCLIYGYMRSQSTGLLLASVTVTATRVPTQAAYAGGILVGTTRSAVTDGGGLFSLEVEKNNAITPSGSLWVISCAAAGLELRRAFNEDTIDLRTVLTQQ